MLIETITFEVFSKTNGSESFLIENTETNYEMILRHRFTRQIKFTKTFDFQFARERKAPKFIEFAEAVADSLFTPDYGIDEIDEMVGTF